MHFKMKQKMFNSLAITTEASRARAAFPMKRYSTEGKNIPLQKHWSLTWCTLPANFDNVFKDILSLEVRPDDVFVVTFMKCGTTWMQECAWLLLNNLDYQSSKSTSILQRSPFIEYNGINPLGPSAMEFLKSCSSPRLIKSHLPANLLPLELWEKKPKIIYVARNIKDCIVSSYHFLKKLGMWSGDNISDYVDDFLNNEIINTPFWAQTVDFWKMRNEPFIFFVTYEEMKRDLAGVIRKLCTFLDIPQLGAGELETLLEHLSFDNMKANEGTNLTESIKAHVPGVKEDFQFMRRGIVGSFKDELSPEVQDKINKWSKEYLAQHNLTEEDIFGKF